MHHSLQSELDSSSQEERLLPNLPDSHLAVHDDGSPQAVQQVLQADVAALSPGNRAVVLWDKGSQRVPHQAVEAICFHLTVQFQHLSPVAELEVTW